MEVSLVELGFSVYKTLRLAYRQHNAYVADLSSNVLQYRELYNMLHKLLYNSPTTNRSSGVVRILVDTGDKFNVGTGDDRRL